MKLTEYQTPAYREVLQAVDDVTERVDALGLVVPGTDSSNPIGTAGLVQMYNASSGLRLDEQQRLCIAPANESDIDTGTSHNKPIVPAFMPYALRKFGDNFRVKKVPRNSTFMLHPGMIALIFPWKSYGSIASPSGTIIDTKGVSIVFTTDKVNSADVLDEKGTKYYLAAISVSGLTSTSSHNVYDITYDADVCWFVNSHSDTSGSGYAYIYYLG